jgi:hypothetical protein
MLVPIQDDTVCGDGFVLPSAALSPFVDEPESRPKGPLS